MSNVSPPVFVHHSEFPAIENCVGQFVKNKIKITVKKSRYDIILMTFKWENRFLVLEQSKQNGIHSTDRLSCLPACPLTVCWFNILCLSGNYERKGSSIFTVFTIQFRWNEKCSNSPYKVISQWANNSSFKMHCRKTIHI